MRRKIYVVGPVAALMAVVAALSWISPAVRNLNAQTSQGPSEIVVKYGINNAGHFQNAGGDEARQENGHGPATPASDQHAVSSTLSEQDGQTCTWHFISGQWYRICENTEDNATTVVAVTYVVDNGQITEVRDANGNRVAQQDTGPSDPKDGTVAFVATDERVEGQTCTWHFIGGQWYRICS